MELKFEVGARIKKPIAEVFQAVQDPRLLSQYFTTAGASAPLIAGTTVQWDFADHPGAFPVKVIEVKHNEKIVIEWEASDGVSGGAGYNTRVEMTFTSVGADSTSVKISETGWREQKNGLAASYGNCGGWMAMICFLKAHLEYGIQLRKDFI